MKEREKGGGGNIVMEMVRAVGPKCAVRPGAQPHSFKYVPSGLLSAAREGTERGGGPGCCLYCMGMLAALATTHARGV